MNQRKITKSAPKSASKSPKRSTVSNKAIVKKTRINNKKRFNTKKKSNRKFSLVHLSGIGQKKRSKKNSKTSNRKSVDLAALANRFINIPVRVVLVLAVVATVIVLSRNIQASATGNNGLVSIDSIEKLQPSHTTPTPVTTPGPAQSDSRFSTYPTWSQDFAHYGSSSINKHYWNIDIGSPDNDNHEAEYYTDNPANLRINNGNLVMEATKQTEPNGLQYASSSVDTNGKASFLYGRIDVTAEIPVGIGTWPAVWFLPANNKYEDLSPASNPNRYLNGGEIDLLEAVGSNPNIIYSIVHTLQTNKTNPDAIGDFNQITLANNNSEYYTYSLLWTPSTISFEVNNTTFFTYTRQSGADYTTWPFDQPFYMIMNLAVGGSWGGENGIDSSAFPASMNIKSVYYYSYLSKNQ